MFCSIYSGDIIAHKFNVMVMQMTDPENGGHFKVCDAVMVSFYVMIDTRVLREYFGEQARSVHTLYKCEFQ